MIDGGHGCVLYDPLAVAADPPLGTFEPMAISGPNFAAARRSRVRSPRSGRETPEEGRAIRNL